MSLLGLLGVKVLLETPLLAWKEDGCTRRLEIKGLMQHGFWAANPPNRRFCSLEIRIPGLRVPGALGPQGKVPVNRHQPVCAWRHLRRSSPIELPQWMLSPTECRGLCRKGVLGIVY